MPRSSQHEKVSRNERSRLIDAAAALEHASGTPALAGLGGHHRYHHRVFLTPPWPEIYRQDEERPHGLDAAIEEYERLRTAYEGLGYATIIVPKLGVRDRAAFVLAHLDA